MNEEKFNEIYRQYHQVLYFCSLRIVSSPEIAKDIIQDVFTEFWFHRTKVDSSKSIKNYLYTLTRNRSFDYIRSTHCRLSLTECLLDEYLQPTFSTEEEISLKELTKEIDIVIDILPEKCRTVFILSRKINLPNAEIAHLLGINVKTVEKHITKAISSLREHLCSAGYLGV